MKLAILSPYPTFPFREELGCEVVDARDNATWTVALADALAQIPDTEVHVLTESTVVPESRVVARGQLNVHFIRAPRQLKTLSFWQFDRKRLLREINEIQPDLVHGQGIENQYGYIALTSGRPCLLTVHGIPQLSNQAQQYSRFSRLRIVEVFAKFCLRRARNLVVINPFIAEFLRLDPHLHHLFEIPNPVAAHFFENAEVAREPDLLVSVGWIDRLKAHDVLLQAVALLRRRGIRVRCVIVGPRPGTEYFRLLQQFIADEQLEVEFPGFLHPAQIANLMRRSTALVHPSRHDNAPMSICEAMATSTPVVASRVGGIPYMVQEGETGFLCEPGNAAEFADKIERLLTDAGLRARFGQAARKLAERFHPASVARQTRQAYETVLRQEHAAPAVRSANRPTLLDRHKSSVKQVAAVLPASWRQFPDYWEWRWFLRQAQFWSAEHIAAWQLAHLKKIVRYAYWKTPGYRHLYDEAGVHPDDLRSLDDLRHFPFTTKELFRDNLEEFSVPRRGRRYVTTGGSTGIPFGFYLMRANESIESAFMHTLWTRVGWQLGRPGAVLRGGFIGTAAQPWHYDLYREELLLSSYHLTEKTLPVYLEAMRRYRVQSLQAYPSSLHLLCRLLQDAGQPHGTAVRVILLGSENVYDWQLDLFQQIFPQARFLAWYGHAERAILAPWCERTRKFHAWPLYGITEVLGADNQPVAQGAEGELVGTGLHNFVTPFIRYRTMDLAVAGATGCAACGRRFPLLEQISGRSHELIVTATGRHISMTAINMHDRTFDALRQFQFYQDTPGRVVFKYIAKTPLGALDAEQIRQALSKKLGSDMELTLQSVDEIPLTPRGKYRFLDQRLNIKYGDRSS
jgi:phenylacetate-CoA ligase